MAQSKQKEKKKKKPLHFKRFIIQLLQNLSKSLIYQKRLLKRFFFNQWKCFSSQYTHLWHQFQAKHICLIKTPIQAREMGLFLPLIQTLPWEDCIKIEIFRFWHEPGRKRTWARGYCTETHRLGSSWAKWAKSPNFSLISPNTTFHAWAGHYPVTRGMLWACPRTS